VFHRLQEELVYQLRHTAGLNPKAFQGRYTRAGPTYGAGLTAVKPLKPLDNWLLQVRALYCCGHCCSKVTKERFFAFWVSVLCAVLLTMQGLLHPVVDSKLSQLVDQLYISNLKHTLQIMPSMYEWCVLFLGACCRVTCYGAMRGWTYGRRQ
jgi:hypothetical protein